MRTSDFHYHLPPERIAQAPAEPRDRSRLLVVHRRDGVLEHRSFFEITAYLRPGDVLVLNDSKVIPARLRAVKPDSNGQVEVLLLSENSRNDWWAMLRPGKRVRPGTLLQFVTREGHLSDVSAELLQKNPEGHGRLQFRGVPDIRATLEELGEVPLPPYILRPSGPRVEDRSRYQTVYAARPGSVAAPTAGLHFTPSLLRNLEAHGVQICFVTLHVGLATFAPVKSPTPEGHHMHNEAFSVPPDSWRALVSAKSEQRRVIPVGTTSARVLESIAPAIAAQLGQDTANGPSPATSLEAPPMTARTPLFIYPPFSFRVVDALITNFHLPESTLLMLVSAFAAPGTTAGTATVLRAYDEAIRQGYRFYSYGDAMLML